MLELGRLRQVVDQFLASVDHDVTPRILARGCMPPKCYVDFTMSQFLGKGCGTYGLMSLLAGSSAKGGGLTMSPRASLAIIRKVYFS